MHTLLGRHYNNLKKRNYGLRNQSRSLHGLWNLPGRMPDRRHQGRLVEPARANARPAPSRKATSTASTRTSASTAALAPASARARRSLPASNLRNTMENKTPDLAAGSFFVISSELERTRAICYSDSAVFAGFITISARLSAARISWRNFWMLSLVRLLMAASRAASPSWP